MFESYEQILALFWMAVAVVALFPLVIFYISYKRIKSDILLFTTIAFLLFFIKALSLGMRLFISEANEEIWFLDDEFWWTIAALLDICIIALISLSLLKKK